MRQGDFPSRAEYNKAWKKANRKSVSDYVNKLKSEMGCADCGNNNPVVLQFHHHDERANGVYVSRMSSTHAVDTEIKRCTLLCANCHLIRHHQEDHQSVEN